MYSTTTSCTVHHTALGTCFFMAERPHVKKLRVAFVGCGNIAQYHASAALATGRVVITALIDPLPEARLHCARLLSGHEAPQQFDSLQDALAADPEGQLFEAVDIMVPSFMVDGRDLHEVSFACRWWQDSVLLVSGSVSRSLRH